MSDTNNEVEADDNDEDWFFNTDNSVNFTASNNAKDLEADFDLVFEEEEDNDDVSVSTTSSDTETSDSDDDESDDEDDLEQISHSRP